jgi:hypothetical protein
VTLSALLAIAILAHFAPEFVADLTNGSIRAWEYVFGGVETTALWLFAGASAAGAFRALAAYGAMESAAKPMCRLAFPMDRAPIIPPGAMLCDVALGAPTVWFSCAAAFIVASKIYEEQGGQWTYIQK